MGFWVISVVVPEKTFSIRMHTAVNLGRHLLLPQISITIQMIICIPFVPNQCHIYQLGIRNYDLHMTFY